MFTSSCSKPFLDNLSVWVVWIICLVRTRKEYLVSVQRGRTYKILVQSKAVRHLVKVFVDSTGLLENTRSLLVSFRQFRNFLMYFVAFLMLCNFLGTRLMFFQYLSPSNFSPCFLLCIIHCYSMFCTFLSHFSSLIFSSCVFVTFLTVTCKFYRSLLTEQKC